MHTTPYTQPMSELFQQRLSDRDFARVARLVEESAGIHLPDHKRSMVELRMARRARAIGISGLAEYCALVFEGQDASTEKLGLIDAITTNKTEFFREEEHFERLERLAIPELRTSDPDLGTERPFRVWSAGCSTGEEPYSIAMVLAAYARWHAPFEFEVLGTDLSTSAVAEARRAVYPEERIVAVPKELRRTSLLRSKDRSLRLVRIAPEIREHVRLSAHNLLSSVPPSDDLFDVIFCRNVIIYFKRETQVRVLAQLARSLVRGGFLFVGHSETLHGMDLPLEHVAPTVYRRPMRA